MGSAGAAAPQLLHEPALGFHIAQGNAAHFAAAAAAGGRFTVVVFSWRDIQPAPEYFYWETPDAAMRAAAYYGLEVVARLDRPPDWARVEGGTTPWDLNAYANFTRLVAERYGAQLAGAIVWNEPNLALEWDGRTPNPTEYAAMLRAAYPAIKAEAPGLPVLAAGLAFTAGDGAGAVNDLAYLEQLYAAGAGAYFDILAAHPYGFGQPPEQPPAEDRLNFRRIELHRALMAAADEDKPIWITEMGWRTSAPEADRWQVVTQEQQRQYSLGALAWAGRYPWLQRMAFWELNDGADLYGYALWQGDERGTPAYAALGARHRRTDGPVEREEAQARSDAAEGAAEGTVDILAPDVVVRLGDRGELHPHWVHLHRGGQLFSPAWRGEFFAEPEQVEGSYELVLETLQVDQPTNRIAINGRPIGVLRPRTRPDPTSTWVTQRLAVPQGVLREGANEIVVTAGLRLPVRQYAWWRWENFQFRNLRLADEFVFPAATIEWEEQPGNAQPDGWAETNRVRLAAGNGNIWVTANRSGQVWRLPLGASAPELQSARGAGVHGERVFLDVAEARTGGLLRQVAATDGGLLWRERSGAWLPVRSAPAAYAYVVIEYGGTWYAGFEGRGAWSAQQPQGPWQPLGLQGSTVLDLAGARWGVAAGSDSGVQVLAGRQWRRLPPLPATGAGSDAATHANFVPRLWTGDDGALVVRSDDRLWEWAGPLQEEGTWLPFGPPELQGSLLAVIGCCGEGVQVGTNGKGLWQREAGGGWRRVDGGFFENLEINAGVMAGGVTVVGTANGLFQQEDAGAWRRVEGLPATITDILIDPRDADLWVAATPAGVFRSRDGGGTWEPITPPWVVWDLAWGADRSLWAARSAGVIVGEGLDAPGGGAWRTVNGMENVTFFTVSPHPQEALEVWGGTWGNNVGVLNTGGEEMRPLHNGLETLSVLAILRHPTPGQYTIGTIEGLFRSDDGGASWFKLPGALARQTVYALHQGAQGVIWAGAADGLWRSEDYGASWGAVRGLPPAAAIRVGEVMWEAAEMLWAGTEESGMWLSRDGGATWDFGGLAGHSVYAVVAAKEGGKLIAATDLGLQISQTTR